uniref:Uncharacterized protein n=1 Tax=Rhipicephalus zambeziensis TaxID=60191 RepID=A0A224Y7S8_9ACAR
MRTHCVQILGSCIAMVKGRHSAKYANCDIVRPHRSCWVLTKHLARATEFRNAAITGHELAGHSSRMHVLPRELQVWRSRKLRCSLPKSSSI